MSVIGEPVERRQCVDVASDGVWVGRELRIECAHTANCRIHGCFWRRFHDLSPEQYRRRELQRNLFEDAT